MPDLTEIRIILADDHPVVRGGLRAAIEKDPGLHVVAEAGNGGEALELARKHRPDVLVSDISMPVMDGLRLAEEIRRAGLPVKVIFLSVHREPEFIERALATGARGYVLKDTAMREIVAGIREVAKGGSYASAVVTAHLFERRQGAIEAARTMPGVEVLTPAEVAVLRLVGDCKTSTEIGEHLRVSPRTVDTHRNNICAKLGLRGKHALVKFAMDNRVALEGAGSEGV